MYLITYFSSGGGDGAEIIYALRNNDTLSRTIANEFIKSGQNVRKYYQRRLPSNSSKDYYYMLRETPNNESIIVEYGFADSTGDDVNQIKNNWQGLTEAVVRGLATYIGVPYIPPAGSENNYYTVKKGDTLYSIANQYGISVDALKKANNLTSNNLTIGQTLIIPTVEEPPITNDEGIYIVKAGDTLYKIANMYGMSVNELKNLNNLTSNTLTIGQRLRVQNIEMPSANTYIVKAGDSLYSIAKQFNISVDELKRTNNKTSNLLNIGEILTIPLNNDTSSSNTYIVQPGDSLYAIASKFNITVDQLKAANNKTNNNLAIGEILIIPNNSSSGTYHTVKSGDTLYSIANAYNTTVDNIKRLNNLINNILTIGTILRIS